MAERVDAWRDVSGALHATEVEAEAADCRVGRAVAAEAAWRISRASILAGLGVFLVILAVSGSAGSALFLGGLSVIVAYVLLPRQDR